MTNVFKPKTNKSTPAAAPPIKKIEPPQRKLGSEDDADQNLRRRRGKGSLRIDLQTGGNGLSKTGINVPQG